MADVRRDLGALLPEEQLGRLRRRYDRSLLVGGARQAIAGRLGASASWLDAFLGTYYAGEPLLPAAEREQLILALLAAEGAPAGMLAVHVYWGLMEGLTPERIASTLLLVGHYRGLPRLTAALGVVTDVLVLLGALGSEGEARLATAEVLRTFGERGLLPT